MHNDDVVHIVEATLMDVLYLFVCNLSNHGTRVIHSIREIQPRYDILRASVNTEYLT